MSPYFLRAATGPAQFPRGTLPEVAVAGRSNVGKSSLINTLLGCRDLAKTSRTPGRTQAIVFFSVDDRWLLVDLPGYGYAKVPEAVRRQWRPLVEAYLAGRETLRLLLLLIDIRRDVGEEERDLVSWLSHRGIPWLPVLTKADKLSRSRALTRRRELMGQLPGGGAGEPVLFSARTGEGKKKLGDTIPIFLQNKAQ
ncbi:MAG TPA: ribosome biogenesis GTP-binding protein YihA/YsxC [Syntrophales bacterium]|nr:ribosome biogenesis GTP-binding protein YihA/YsxC [Syntrophales bacterium]HRS86924.1 ribosome biogenesis GTP-binding protein YihA/YsxC [Syntrophales bacterium]HRV43573.1 ribosome biogenesis GTP-binding protein YihA/YsxC [Syntrophales bacterium]